MNAARAALVTKMVRPMMRKTEIDRGRVCCIEFHLQVIESKRSVICVDNNYCSTLNYFN